MQDTLHQEPPDAEPRRPLRHRRTTRQLAAAVPAQPVLPDADAGDRLPGRGCRRGVEGLLAARRHDLRPHGQRPQRVLVVVCDLLRPDGARASSRASSPPPARCSSAIPWTDTNGDGFVQADRSQHHRAVPEQEHGLRPGEPDQHQSPTRVDPNVKNDRTREFIVGFDRQLELADGGRRQLHLAQVRSVPLERSRRLHQRELSRRELPRRPTCPAGARCDSGDLLRADDPAAVGERLHQPSRIGSATSTASS